MKKMQYYLRLAFASGDCSAQFFRITGVGYAYAALIIDPQR